MRFLMFYTPDATVHVGPPTPEYMEQMQRLIEASLQSGEMIATGGLTPIQNGARVVQAKGGVNVIDGPYIESTEVIGGFALFELPSKEAAIAKSKEFLKVAGDGLVTVRPLMDEAETCVNATEAVTQHA